VRATFNGAAVPLGDQGTTGHIFNTLSGFFRSDDGGLTWQPIGNGIPDAVIRGASSIDLTVSDAADPVTGNRPVYAAVIRGGQISNVCRSADLGATWTPMSLPGDADGGINPGGQGLSHLSFVADNRDPHIVYAGGDRQTTQPNSTGSGDFTGRLFRGDSRLGVLTGNPNLTFNSDGVNPDTIFRASGNWRTDGFTDGALITVQGPGANNNTTHRIATIDAAGTTLNLTSVGGITAQAPANGFTVRNMSLGAQWASLTDNRAMGTGPHADSRALLFDARGNLYDVDDGGVYKLVNPVAFVHPTLPGHTAVLQGTPTLAFANANPDTITRGSDPMLGKDHYSGYASVLRNNWGTPQETVLWLFNGDWYADHRHYQSGTGPTDHGSVVLYALGAPVSINWGSFYTPQTSGGGMKSVVMPESRFSSWAAGYDLTYGSGWRSSSNEMFGAFSQSGFSSARMRSIDGLEWSRRAFSLHPRSDLPVIVIQDDFAGANPTQPKIVLFNMMAQGSVGTPGGAITPQVVTGGNVTAGPSFTLSAGLNRLAFTGQTWNAHPTRGIDWDVYTSSAESLSGNVGNWGHTWHPNTEQVQFLQANGRAFEEHQHILRMRGSGSFRTFILPFRKGEKPGDLQVRQNGSNLEITTAGHITTINDNWYAFTNTQKRILTTFSSAQAQAFGLSASGGPTEVILEANRALITAHGNRGPRRVKIPATWKPVVAGVVPAQEFGEWVLNYDSEGPVTIVLE